MDITPQMASALAQIYRGEKRSAEKMSYAAIQSLINRKLITEVWTSKLARRGRPKLELTPDGLALCRELFGEHQGPVKSVKPVRPDVNRGT